ncbi:hypothetical protein NPIL_134491 [Nephila pilipes]|uniref:Uncharacterized protein n=1 Tax=Nephila pilipes TaxID=299642 RepID=A0A8X6MNS2_NEPPI|nr:hypothetical protein NPIL_134491 [Nephila pilipes]
MSRANQQENAVEKAEFAGGTTLSHAGSSGNFTFDDTIIHKVLYGQWSEWDGQRPPERVRQKLLQSLPIDITLCSEYLLRKQNLIITYNLILMGYFPHPSLPYSKRLRNRTPPKNHLRWYRNIRAGPLPLHLNFVPLLDPSRDIFSKQTLLIFIHSPE